MVIDGGDLTKAAHAGPWDGASISARLVKSAPERRFGLYVAYPANRPDSGVAADGYQDFAGTDAVEDAAWSYMLKHRAVGLDHMQGTDGAGVVAESYIYRGPRWVIKAADGSEQAVEPGDWLVGIVWNPEAWELVKSGRINGVSMQGTASRRKPTPEALAALRR